MLVVILSHIYRRIIHCLRAIKSDAFFFRPMRENNELVRINYQDALEKKADLNALQLILFLDLKQKSLDNI